MSRYALYARPQAEPVGNGALTAQLVKTGLYMYSGSSSSLLRMGVNRLIVVNAQSDYDAFLKQVRRISGQPIRLLITTDRRPEHTPMEIRSSCSPT